MTRKPLQFRLNGAEKAVFTEEGQNLLDLLRRGVGDLTPKYGCGQGTCGTCTVLLDGEPHLACLTLAETVEGRQVATAAGLAEGAELHALQKAFMDNFAAQCGFCTPGMLLSTKALLDHSPSPSRDEIRQWMSANVCRCTGYNMIIEAVEVAAATMAGNAGEAN